MNKRKRKRRQNRSVDLKCALEQPGSRLWYLALLAIVFLLGCFDIESADIWWHLKTGELILDRWEVPKNDWFTYTNPDATWIDLHWTFQIMVAIIWAFGGPVGLILAKCAVVTISVAVCLAIGGSEIPTWLKATIWLVPILIVGERYIVRPEVISMFLMCLTLWVVHNFLKRPSVGWALPVIQIAWVNVQGIFVLQFVIMACYTVGKLKAVMSRETNWNAFPWRNWASIFAVTLAASTCNPYGIRGTLFPFELSRKLQGEDREFFHQFSEELKGIDSLIEVHGVEAVVTNYGMVLTWLVVLLCAITFVPQIQRRQLNLYRLLLFMAFAYLTWQMARNRMFFGIIAGVVMQANLGELPVLLQSRNVERIVKACLGTILALLLITIPTDFYHRLSLSIPPRHFGFSFSPSPSHGAAKFLKELDSIRYIYANDLGVAAVCIFHLGPEKKVFADARLELNTRETLSRFEQIPSQLVHDMPAAIENLTRGTESDAQPSVDSVAILFENAALLGFSASEADLFGALTSSEKWRCVFSDFPAANPLAGTTLFVSEDYAKRNDLVAVDTSRLKRYLDLARPFFSQAKK